MKRNYRYWLVCGLIFISMTCMPAVMMAQPNPGDCGNQDPDLPPCPVDGGLSLLVVAGIAYGAKKARDTRNKNAVNTI
ncbi:hypothetical protein QWZ08_09660 [Ferruginibacter paludis]|uniref:PID-CTERM protein-sorting domain-containing protein n=1 Tax=Ferruginibacter paludis TaxID=1310417 RepID=UPI0025B4DE5A|nr:hypothetical protein [Ferruginibacter paludis]MDN3655890.1 hypothetical protein [Ferruginibacter paludis]